MVGGLPLTKNCCKHEPYTWKGILTLQIIDGEKVLGCCNPKWNKTISIYQTRPITSATRHIPISGGVYGYLINLLKKTPKFASYDKQTIVHYLDTMTSYIYRSANHDHPTAIIMVIPCEDNVDACIANDYGNYCLSNIKQYMKVHGL